MFMSWTHLECVELLWVINKGSSHGHFMGVCKGGVMVLKGRIVTG